MKFLGSSLFDGGSSRHGGGGRSSAGDGYLTKSLSRSRGMTALGNRRELACIHTLVIRETLNFLFCSLSSTTTSCGRVLFRLLIQKSRFPILTLNFKTFKESQHYISQSCITPGDVPCWAYARKVDRRSENRKTD